MKSQGVQWTTSEYEAYLKRTGQRAPAPILEPIVLTKPTTKSSEPNKTEAAYWRLLKSQYPECEVRFNQYTLKLGDNCRYTPDLAVVHPDGKIDFHEVKGGFIFEKAMYKPRMAASEFPHHKFFLAQKKQGEWIVKQIGTHTKICPK